MKCGYLYDRVSLDAWTIVTTGYKPLNKYGYKGLDAQFINALESYHDEPKKEESISPIKISITDDHINVSMTSTSTITHLPKIMESEHFKPTSVALFNNPTVFPQMAQWSPTELTLSEMDTNVIVEQWLPSIESLKLYGSIDNLAMCSNLTSLSILFSERADIPSLLNLKTLNIKSKGDVIIATQPSLIAAEISCVNIKIYNQPKISYLSIKFDTDGWIQVETDATFPHLYFLFLRNYPLCDINILNHTRFLRYFRLSSNNVNDLDGLLNLNHLKLLFINCPNVTDFSALDAIDEIIKPGGNAQVIVNSITPFTPPKWNNIQTVEKPDVFMSTFSSK